MVRQTIALSRSCFIVQKYISPFDKRKNSHLCLNLENPCWIQALLAPCWLKSPNLHYFSDLQYCIPVPCSALPAKTSSCETFPGNMAFIYQVTLPLCTWPEEYGESLDYSYLLVPAVVWWWCELWL